MPSRDRIISSRCNRTYPVEVALRLHNMPRRMLRALGEGRGGTEAVLLLRNAQRSKNLMLIRTVVQMATARGHPDAPTATRAYRVLLRLHEQTPEPVDR